MKKLIFGLGIMVAGLTCAVASANDYYYGGDCCPAPCGDPCGTEFDGFYFGGNLGVLTNIAYRNDLDQFAGGSQVLVDTDFTIGLQLGYDWNCGCSLFGLVVDWNWANIDHSHHSFTDNRLRNELDWFLTIRGRAGITVCDCLFYLTAGAVVADFDARWRTTTSSTHHDDTRWGWTGGVGVEYLLGCNWSIGADLLFMHFDN